MELLQSHGSIKPRSSSTSLDEDLQTAGHPLQDVGVVISEMTGHWIHAVLLSAAQRTQPRAGGWGPISLPVSQLDPTTSPIGTLDLENALPPSMNLIHIDDVHFVGS